MRRTLYAGLVLLAAALSLATLHGCSSAGAQSNPPSGNPTGKPNIVYIAADDMRYDDLKFMPRLRESLANPREFDRAYVSLASCCPSRSTMLTGQYPHNHRTLTNIPGRKGGRQAFVKSGAEDRTIAVALQNAGYETALFGKYMNGYEGGEEAPDDLSGGAGEPDSGYPHSGYPRTGSYAEVPPGWDKWYSHIGQGSGMKLADGSRVRDFPSEEIDSVVFDEAEHYAGGSKDAPFFMLIGAHSPHTPYTAPEEYDSLYRGIRFPKTPAYNERNNSDKGGWVGDQKRLTKSETRDINIMYRERARALRHLDDRIASLSDALKESGEFEDTRFVFTSDNGYHLGEHRLRPGKTAPYEEDIRVPLLVGGEGIESGGDDRLAINNDLAPTFAEWGGAELEVEPDGRSLAPLLEGDSPKWREKFLVEKIGGRGKYNYRAVKVGAQGFTFVRYLNGDSELYNLRRDPRQLSSYWKKSSPAVKRKMQSKIRELSVCRAEECVAAENRR